MKKLFSFLTVLTMLLLGANYAHATGCPTTTVSSTGLVDSDGFTWAGGTWSATIYVPPQALNPPTLACTVSGDTLTTTYSGTLNSSGAFSQALPKNENITAAGTEWAITFCPNATSGCYTYTTPVSGSTLDITTALNTLLPGPRFRSNFVNYGYGTVELVTPVGTGNTFLNTTTGILQSWNGSAWQNYASGFAVNSTGNLVNTSSLLVDDFCGATPSVTATIGQLGWDKTVLVTGTNPVAAVASVANHPCLITLTTDTTATNGVGITLGNAVGVLFPGASTNWQSEQIVKINQITSGSYRVGFGTVDSATGIPTNGIYFRFLNGTDTYIEACSDSSGSETCHATTVTPTALDYVDFFMNSTTTGKVSFTVTDITTPATSTVTLCPSGCTGTATLPTVVLSPTFNIAETGSSAVDVLTVDYFAFQQAITR